MAAEHGSDQGRINGINSIKHPLTHWQQNNCCSSQASDYNRAKEAPNTAALNTAKCVEVHVLPSNIKNLWLKKLG